jgi:hypothetical protein
LNAVSFPVLLDLLSSLGRGSKLLSPIPHPHSPSSGSILIPETLMYTPVAACSAVRQLAPWSPSVVPLDMLDGKQYRQPAHWRVLTADLVLFTKYAKGQDPTHQQGGGSSGGGSTSKPKKYTAARLLISSSGKIILTTEYAKGDKPSSMHTGGNNGGSGSTKRCPDMSFRIPTDGPAPPPVHQPKGGNSGGGTTKRSFLRFSKSISNS